MAIDDPLSALEVLDDSDERQRSPLSRFRKPLLAIAKLLGPPGTDFAASAVEAADEWLNGRPESNIRELPGLTADALRRAEQCRVRERALGCLLKPHLVDPPCPHNKPFRCRACVVKRIASNQREHRLT
jgi:hypothetical protein